MKLKNDWPKVVLLIALFLMGVGLVFVQIDRSDNATKLESALLSGFQFLISLAFTWILSFWVFEISHKDKQKKFALGAFRRIKEIERNIIRTSDYVDDVIRNGEDTRPSLGIIRANLRNARDTVLSSIYDWSDIIEDEIEISAQIEKLERSMSAESEQGPKSTSHEIEKLSQKLPPSLRQVVRDDHILDETKQAADYLRRELRENGYLDLRGFWEARDAFMRNISNLKPGDPVYIARGITKNRPGPILAYDADGNSLGVITNRCAVLNSPYDVFANALDRVFEGALRPKLFGGNPIEAIIKEVDNSNIDTDPKRKRFEVWISKDKLDALAIDKAA